MPSLIYCAALGWATRQQLWNWPEMFTQIRPFPPHSFLMEIRPKVGRSHAALSNKFLADPPTFLQRKLRLKGTKFVRERPHPLGSQLEPLNQVTRPSLAVPGCRSVWHIHVLWSRTAGCFLLKLCIMSSGECNVSLARKRTTHTLGSRLYC